MQPPIFTVCASDPEVTALLGSDTTRLFPFGDAPQGVKLPYAVFQRISGFPENYLADRPDADSFSMQIDVYAKTGSEADQVAEAIMKAIELKAYVVRHGTADRDPKTKNFNVSFDVDWILLRSAVV